jgi:hypothetical protein
MAFEVATENINSDILNFTIRVPEVTRTVSTMSYMIGLRLLEIYGNGIQMDNYKEYIFVRCWNNPQDFIENDWDGYLVGKDGRFVDIEMKFNIYLNYDVMDKIIQPEICYGFRKNDFLPAATLLDILNKYVQDIKLRIPYYDLLKIKRRLESYVMRLEDNTDYINILEHKFENYTISSIIYALGMYDPKYLKSIKGKNLNNMYISDFLDIFFPQ